MLILVCTDVHLCPIVHTALCTQQYTKINKHIKLCNQTRIDLPYYKINPYIPEIYQEIAVKIMQYEHYLSHSKVDFPIKFITDCVVF